jgi:hypothetical protein
MKRIWLLTILLLPSFLLAQSNNQTAPVEKNEQLDKLKFSPKEDFIESMQWAWQGSYKQFQGTQNKVFAALALVSIGYFIDNDQQISQKIATKHKNEKLFRVISDSSIFFNTPIMPMAFYILGAGQQDAKMVRFSQEYLAALTLALLETAAISMVPVHQRPDQKDLSFWEKAFRGQSSFPSGHVVGFSVLSFKTLQFYGPGYALLPIGLGLATAFERVHAEKHYASDVIASGFISLLASEGVRYASGYDKNHPIYEWIFNHNFGLQYIRVDRAPGVQVSWNF